MCVKLVASYPRSIKAVITAKGASTKSWVKGLNTHEKCDILISLNDILKSFCLLLWCIVCRLMRGKNYLVNFRMMP
jgi:hypothetical protein